MRKWPLLLVLLFPALLLACATTSSGPSHVQSVPHVHKWGIYVLDLATLEVQLVYSTTPEIVSLDLNPAGDTLAFSVKSATTEALDPGSEIYAVGVDGSGLARLTDNSYFDTYPSFSPDGSKIAFLSTRSSTAGATLDIYVMNSDGSGQQLVYDSGGHDADVCWGSTDRIAFTRDHQIWSIKSDGSDPRQVTDPANAGLWGSANLPIGDYDPRFCPSASRIAFERLVDVSTSTGSYEIFVIRSNGTSETQVTTTGYAQGFANWSHDGQQLVFIVAAIAGEGKYDIYLMNADGSLSRNVTPDYFPAEFLCHNAVFSQDNSQVYFIGQWYGD